MRRSTKMSWEEFGDLVTNSIRMAELDEQRDASEAFLSSK